MSTDIKKTVKRELTATEVLSRVYGYGLVEADMALVEVSAQDRGNIVAAYEKGDSAAIHAILSKKSDEIEAATAAAEQKVPAKGKLKSE